eukprot:m.40751 g.40751  ORF g.40751 m.40751 type:complete len:406 (-) comp14851_c0_seq2:984-2201(-)
MSGRPLPQRSNVADHWGLDKKVVFLNHGSFGACPTFVREEFRKWQDLLETEPVRFYEEIAPEATCDARKALARLVSCDPDDLALIENATSGVNTILRSLRFNKGDEILVPDHAYAACRNVLDFVASHWGAVVVTAHIPFPISGPQIVIDAVMDSVSDRTVLAMIDTVSSPTALRMPFEELTARLEGNGIRVLLDAAHGVGIVPLRLSELGASYATSNCHKWLCAPKGCAFLHVRRDRQEEIHPLVVSHGMSHPLEGVSRFRHEFDWTGTRDLSAQCSLPAVIDGIPARIFHGTTWLAIMQQNRKLVLTGRNILCKRLNIEAPCPDEMVSSMATLRLPDNDGVDAMPEAHKPDQLHKVLREKYNIQVPVMVWASPAGRYLRISAQLYNHVDEYHYLADALAVELGS